MSRDMLLSAVVNNLVGAAFTVFAILTAFFIRKLWRRHGATPSAARSGTQSRSRYTCPSCGQTAVINPLVEEIDGHGVEQ